MPRDIFAAMAAVVHAEAIRRYQPTRGAAGAAHITPPPRERSTRPQPALLPAPAPASARSPWPAPAVGLARLLAMPRHWWSVALAVVAHRGHRPAPR
ncbi:hypothetical protein [Gandjariella thermophila]|nr:hypothetical protein [Gandjariella thermophila]